VVLALGVTIALAIFLDSGGPVFFVQERVGKKDRPFKMYKFRTLHNGGESAAHDFMQAYIKGEVGETDGRRIFKPDTIRVTRVGQLLRRASLDELPQLINVMRGEMSLVGPRPHIAKEVAAYRPWHHRRLNGLPGITGLAQVSGRSSISFDRMVRYDIDYLERQSLGLDLRILLRTIKTVLRGDGAAIVLLAAVELQSVINFQSLLDVFLGEL